MNGMIHLFIFLVLLGFARTTKNYSVLVLPIVTFPVGFFALFKFLLRTPQIKIIKSRRKIDAEVISAVRFLVLDLRANAPLFDAMNNLTENFEEIGIYLKDVINEVRLGSSLEKSLNKLVESVPSEDFRALIWQLLNHLESGVDITDALTKLVDEIAETQKIEFKKYGKKLNVVSLLYMIIAIILPTIGFTIIAAILIFIGFEMTLWTILLFWMLFSMMQGMFLVISGGNRPITES
jgi:Flp pilus assembly protein TadB